MRGRAHKQPRTAPTAGGARGGPPLLKDQGFFFGNSNNLGGAKLHVFRLGPVAEARLGFALPASTKLLCVQAMTDLRTTH